MADDSSSSDQHRIQNTNQGKSRIVENQQHSSNRSHPLSRAQAPQRIASTSMNPNANSFTPLRSAPPMRPKNDTRKGGNYRDGRGRGTRNDSRTESRISEALQSSRHKLVPQDQSYSTKGAWCTWCAASGVPMGEPHIVEDCWVRKQREELYRETGEHFETATITTQKERHAAVGPVPKPNPSQPSVKTQELLQRQLTGIHKRQGLTVEHGQFRDVFDNMQAGLTEPRSNPKETLVHIPRRAPPPNTPVMAQPAYNLSPGYQRSLGYSQDVRQETRNAGRGRGVSMPRGQQVQNRREAAATHQGRPPPTIINNPSAAGWQSFARNPQGNDRRKHAELDAAAEMARRERVERAEAAEAPVTIHETFIHRQDGEFTKETFEYGQMNQCPANRAGAVMFERVATHPDVPAADKDATAKWNEATFMDMAMEPSETDLAESDTSASAFGQTQAEVLTEIGTEEENATPPPKHRTPDLWRWLTSPIPALRPEAMPQPLHTLLRICPAPKVGDMTDINWLRIVGEAPKLADQLLDMLSPNSKHRINHRIIPSPYYLRPPISVSRESSVSVEILVYEGGLDSPIRSAPVYVLPGAKRPIPIRRPDSEAAREDVLLELELIHEDPVDPEKLAGIFANANVIEGGIAQQQSVSLDQQTSSANQIQKSGQGVDCSQDFPSVDEPWAEHDLLPSIETESGGEWEQSDEANMNDIEQSSENEEQRAKVRNLLTKDGNMRSTIKESPNLHQPARSTSRGNGSYNDQDNLRNRDSVDRSSWQLFQSSPAKSKQNSGASKGALRRDDSKSKEKDSNDDDGKGEAGSPARRPMEKVRQLRHRSLEEDDRDDDENDSGSVLNASSHSDELTLNNLLRVIRHMEDELPKNQNQRTRALKAIRKQTHEAIQKADYRASLDISDLELFELEDLERSDSKSRYWWDIVRAVFVILLLFWLLAELRRLLKPAPSITQIRTSIETVEILELNLNTRIANAQQSQHVLEAVADRQSCNSFLTTQLNDTRNMHANERSIVNVLNTAILPNLKHVLNRRNSSQSTILQIPPFSKSRHGLIDLQLALTDIDLSLGRLDEVIDLHILTQQTFSKHCRLSNNINSQKQTGAQLEYVPPAGDIRSLLTSIKESTLEGFDFFLFRLWGFQSHYYPSVFKSGGPYAAAGPFGAAFAEIERKLRQSQGAHRALRQQVQSLKLDLEILVQNWFPKESSQFRRIEEWYTGIRRALGQL